MTITLERETADVRGMMPRTHSCIQGVCSVPCGLRSEADAASAPGTETGTSV